MAVNLYHGGHHPQHLESLRAHWAENFADGELHLVISDAYRDEHPALLDAVDATKGAYCHLVRAPSLRLHRRQGLLASDRLHGQVVSHWAAELGADHIVLMYFDHVQISLAYNLRFDWPLSISGIYFRPTFHYRDLGMERGFKERVVAIRKKLILTSALRNPHLRYVFCFDSLAVERFPRTHSNARAVTLPEPLYDPSEHGVQSPMLDCIQPGRLLLLLFGSLDQRKGLGPVLDALSSLSEPQQSRLALVLAGRIVGSDREVILERIRSFRSKSKVQIVLEDRYLDEEEIQPLIRACDLMLLTYVQHVGSSGVLVRAAKAGVPVLSSDYGLLGAQVSQNQLGVTVDATSAVAIASTLQRWLVNARSIAFNPEKARAFAATNTADAFARTILSRLLERSVTDDKQRYRGRGT